MAGRILRGAVFKAKTTRLAVVPGRLYQAVRPLHTPSAPSAGGAATTGGAAAVSGGATTISAWGTAQTAGSAAPSITAPPAHSNNWTLRGSILTASDAKAGDDFGYRIATNADSSVIAVTARFWNAALDATAGIYVFVRSGSSWTQRGAVIALSAFSGSPNSNDYKYGDGIAINGDGTTVVIGSAQYGTGLGQVGGVYVYDWDGSSWGQRGSVLTASDAAAGDNFGKGVALSGDGNVLFVGAPNWEGSLTNQGAVYIFDRNGSSWTQRGAVLTAPDAASGDSFGFSVGCSQNADQLVVGATDWEGGTTDQGGAYVFYTADGGTTWAQRGAVITASDPNASDNFAETVSINGDGSFVAIGADQWEGSLTNQGQTYLYDWDGTAWVAATPITATDAAASDLFGPAATDAYGTVLIVGASAWEGSLSNQGGVYVFDYTPPPIAYGAASYAPTASGSVTFNVGEEGYVVSGAMSYAPSVAGTVTFPNYLISGAPTYRPTAAGDMRHDPTWSAAVSSGVSTAQAAVHAYEISWSAPVTSAPSEIEAEAWAGALEMPAVGIGYSAQGAERSAVAAITIACEIAGTIYPAQWLTIRKRLAHGDGTASYGAETADVAIPYTRAVFAALLAAAQAGESLVLSARYVLDSGATYVRPLGEFAMTGIRRSENGATVVASGERFPVYAVSDEPVDLAGSSYETARSVRCAVDHQVYPGQYVRGHVSAFACDAVTISLDAPTASAVMEVFARG